MQFLTIGTDNCLFSVVHQQYFLGGGLTVLVGALAENVVTACVSAEVVHVHLKRSCKN